MSHRDFWENTVTKEDVQEYLVASRAKVRACAFENSRIWEAELLPCDVAKQVAIEVQALISAFISENLTVPVVPFHRSVPAYISASSCVTISSGGSFRSFERLGHQVSCWGYRRVVARSSCTIPRAINHCRPPFHNFNPDHKCHDQKKNLPYSSIFPLELPFRKHRILCQE